MGAASNNNLNPFATIAATAALVAPLLYYYKYKKQEERQEQEDHAALTRIARRGSHLKPPFPQIVRTMLSKCRLAYLSTVDTAEASSHLSLMRFTYLNDKDDGEVVIMSTNTKTKKFDMLKKQRGVALLVHDFGGQSSSSGVYSITLNGECRIVTDKIKAQEYRKAHLAHNPDYPQFIVGDDIAILCVDVTQARICDINDQVTKWDVAENKQLQ